MAKQFVKGNVYVFTKEKYLQEKNKNKSSSKSEIKGYLKGWVNSVNGNEVEILDSFNGDVRGMSVDVEWCKCIKNNNPIKKDKKLNLCSTCKFCFADCANGEEGIDFNFGTGLGFDNVYECKNYKNKSEAI